MIELPKEWSESISYDTSRLFLYDNGELLLTYMYDNYLVINSISTKKLFSKEIIKEIIRMLNTHDKVVLSSTVKSIGRFMSKHGFVFDEANSLYIRS